MAKSKVNSVPKSLRFKIAPAFDLKGKPAKARPVGRAAGVGIYEAKFDCVPANEKLRIAIERTGRAAFCTFSTIHQPLDLVTVKFFASNLNGISFAKLIQFCQLT